MKEIDGYQLLANAIIQQACYDYRVAKRIIQRLSSISDKDRTEEQQKKLDEAKKTVKEVLNFFSSAAFEVLTKASPHYILNKLDEDNENRSGKKSKKKI